MTAMALSPQDLQRIAQSPGWRGGRVEVCDTSQGKVIVKGWRPAHHPARYGLLNRLARWLGLPFLRAVPLAGGAQAQHTEVARLRALRRAGARVPEVLHVGSDHFVMQWLGRAHLGDVLQSGHPGAAALWREAGDELVRLHRAGQYLSQGFARNMIVTDEAGDTPRLAGLIDFEDDPLRSWVWPTPRCATGWPSCTAPCGPCPWRRPRWTPASTPGWTPKARPCAPALPRPAGAWPGCGCCRANADLAATRWRCRPPPQRRTATPAVTRSPLITAATEGPP